MRNTALALLCLSTTCHITHAQVKRTFQDETFAQTTVVIKSDNTSDVEVLDDAFDLDEFGMDQQIRITTEQLQEMQASEEQLASIDQPTSRTTVQQKVSSPAPIQQEKVVAAVSTPTKTDKQPQAITQVQTPSTQSFGPRQSSGMYPVKSNYKLPNKRVKLKKRKRVKTKRKHRCYKF